MIPLPVAKFPVAKFPMASGLRWLNRVNRSHASVYFRQYIATDHNSHHQIPIAIKDLDLFSGHHNINGPENDPNLANLGSTIEKLNGFIPNILHKSLPKSIIAPTVLLRICPTHFSDLNYYLPNIKGHVSYYTTLKTLQIIVSSFILNPNVKLHIQFIKVIKPHTSNIELLTVYPQSTKIYVRWSTCNEGCHHLLPHPTQQPFHQPHKSTSHAKFGSHTWSKVDTSKFQNWKVDAANVNVMSLGQTLSHLTSGLVGLVKENKRLERIVCGVFIFELNETNDKIIVHTIEDVNIIERTEPLPVTRLEIC